MKAYTMGITKANASVDLVRRYFKKMGYQTTSKNKATSNGYDLVVIKKEKSFRIEVKTAYYSARSWKVGKTHNVRNDFIAIVFGDKIHFEDWLEHKLKCSKNGQRTLGRIHNLYV